MSTFANTYAGKITGYGDIKYKNKQGQTVTQKAAAPASGIALPKASSNVMTKNAAKTTTRKSVPYDAASGGWGVRAMAENAGLNDIAWDGSRVTSGTVSLKPSAVVNGTSYAPKQDVHNFIKDAYAGRGDELVQTNRYANRYGLDNLLEYNSASGEVTVDGVPIRYAYIDDDGNSWVPRSVIENAYDDAAARRGIKDGADYVSDYSTALDKSRAARQEAVDSILNWEYDSKALENDPVWQAYKSMYQREGARAQADALAKTAARTGGNLSSAALAQAGQQQNYYLQQQNDVIPQLAQQAYERMATGQQQKFSSAQQDALDAYNLFTSGYNANRDRIDDANTAAEAQRQRFVDAENLKRSKMENEQYEREMRQKAFEDAYNSGYLRGSFTPEERQTLGVGEDMTPYRMALNEYYNYQKPMAQDKLDMEFEDTKRTTDYKTALEQAIWQSQTGVQQQNDLAKIWANAAAEKAKIWANAAAEKNVAEYKNSLSGGDSDTDNVDETFKQAMLLGWQPDPLAESMDMQYLEALAHIANEAGTAAGANGPEPALSEEQMAAIFKKVFGI